MSDDSKFDWKRTADTESFNSLQRAVNSDYISQRTLCFRICPQAQPCHKSQDNFRRSYYGHTSKSSIVASFNSMLTL